MKQRWVFAGAAILLLGGSTSLALAQTPQPGAEPPPEAATPAPGSSAEENPAVSAKTHRAVHHARVRHGYVQRRYPHHHYGRSSADNVADQLNHEELHRLESGAPPAPPPAGEPHG